MSSQERSAFPATWRGRGRHQKKYRHAWSHPWPARRSGHGHTQETPRLFSDAGCLGDSHNRLGELLEGFQAESTALGRGLPSPGLARWRLAWGPTGTPPRVGPALSGGGVGVGSGSAPTRTVGGRRATPPAKPTNARRSELGQAAERATERAGRKPPSGLRAPPSTARKGGTIWESVYAEVQYPHRCRPADTGSLDTHCYRCAGCPRGAREGSCTACLLLSRLMPPW